MNHPLLDDVPGPEALAVLRRHGFAEPERAAGELRTIAADAAGRDVLARLLAHLLPALAAAPDPDAALSHLERFVHGTGGSASTLAWLHERDPERAALLAWALGTSPFIADQLVRHPDWAAAVTDARCLGRVRTAADLAREVRAALARAGPEGSRDALRRIRRREVVRLALQDLRRLVAVDGTLEALSALADALVAGALEVAVGEVRAEAALGPPRAGRVAGFAVLALGKLGGSELNFSSDVDLVYVHRADRGRVSSRGAGLALDAYAEALARRVTSVLGEATHEGHVYRVDLRLRPEGRAGAISHSLRAAGTYYRTRGAAWERLALIKARVVAGDAELSRSLLQRVAPYVWSRPFDADDLAHVLQMKQHSDRRLAARGHGERHVKLGRGGIREIELVTQVLQLQSGGRGRLRARSTLEALAALRATRKLAAPEHDALAHAYLFLRDVENKLQMVHDAQTHLLPEDDAELARLARRLGYASGEGAGATARFRSDLASHTETVHRLFQELLAPPLSGGSAR